MTFTTIAPLDLQLRAKHWSSLDHSLTHRLEVAKAFHNDQLVNLLEQEYQQLLTARQADQRGNPCDAIAAWWQGVWSHIADTIPGLYQLQISDSVDSQGQTVWQAYFPKTGQAFSTSSQTELQSWVKEHYWAA